MSLRLPVTRGFVGRLGSSLVLCLAIAGCAKDIVREIPVEPIPGGCVSVESRTSLFNTQGAILCFRHDGRLAGMTGGPGAPMIRVPLVLLEAAGTVAGGYLIGKGLESLSDIQLDADVTHRVDLPDLPDLPELP